MRFFAMSLLTLLFISAAACGETGLRPHTDDTDDGPDTDTGPTITSMPGWELAWAVHAGGNENTEEGGEMAREVGTAIAPLSGGDVYVAGWAAGAVFGTGEPNETAFPEDEIGWSDAFLARYEADGSLGWVRRIGGADKGTGDYAFDVAALADGSAAVVGRFDAPEIVLGEGEPNETVLASGGEWFDVNAFVARYFADGGLDWAIKIPMIEDSYVYGFSVDELADGQLLVGGTFEGTLWPGTGFEISSMPPESGSSFDGYLAWFEANGSVARAVRTGNGNQLWCHAIAVVDDGSAIVAALYRDGEVFGAGEENETTPGCDGSEPFSCTSLARYGPDGMLEWVRDLRINCIGWGNVSIAPLDSGEIGLIARFGCPSDPDGDGDFYELAAEEPGWESWGVVVAEYRAEDGELLWARMGQNKGHHSYGKARAVVPMPGGGMIAAFAFNETLEFEGDDEGQRPLTSAGDQDIALVSFSSTGEIRWMHRMGGPEWDFPTFGAQLDGTSLWLTGAYRSDPFVPTDGHGNEVALPLTESIWDETTDIYLLRFDATGPAAE